MRKLALILAAAMLLSMAACSGDPAESGVSSGGTAPSQTGTTIEIDDIFNDPTGDVTSPTVTGGTAQSTAADGSNGGQTQNKTNKNPGNTPTNKPTNPGGQTGTSSRYTNSRGKVFQNMSMSYEKLPAAYTVNNTYKIQDLGQMQLEEYPMDGVYDHSYDIMKVGDTYKMWWCRACPHDTIWYAESKDLKNWYNAQRVITLKDVSLPKIKAMLAVPSVLYVGGRYHMFFEAPAELADSGEYSNNVFYATSKDGIDWTMYPNNSNPQPVIKDPNPRVGVYGVGQPKAFYKDGYFYVAYTDASDSGGKIRLARSKNGYEFEGEVKDHPLLISDVAGAAVRYNAKENKYYMTFTISSTENGVYNDNVYIMESSDGVNWPCKTREEALAKATVLTKKNDVQKKANTDFVTNEQGIIDSDTMYFVYMNGVMPKEGEDHRNTHTTWDGHFLAINTGKNLNSDIILPNGNKLSSKTLEYYADQKAAWKRPSINASYGKAAIDGNLDDGYKKGSAAKVETVIWNWDDCAPTDTTATVYFMWDENNLYMHAAVKDSLINAKNVQLDKPGNLWRKDGLDLFIDVPNTMEGGNGVSLTPMTFMVGMAADGTSIVKDNRETVITDELSGMKTTVKTVSGGYNLEAVIPWHSLVKGMIKEGKEIGLDICINDNKGDSKQKSTPYWDKGTGSRMSMVYWSDYKGEAFQYLDRYGNVKLVK